MRSSTPIVRNALVRCAFTVFSLISSRRAICLLGRPSATSASTSRSRDVRASSRIGGALCRQHRACGARVERRLAASGRVDRVQQLPGLGVLQQVADRARIQGLGDPLAVHERRQHDHLHAGSALADQARGLDPAHPRHREVHQGDVGRPARRRSRPRRRRRRPHPTTSSSGSEPISRTSPSRTIGWSSITTTRITRPAPPARTVVPSPCADVTCERAAGRRGQVAQHVQAEVAVRPPLGEVGLRRSRGRHR